MATIGAIYKSTVSGDLFKVVAEEDPFGPGDPGLKQVEIRRLSDGEWYGVDRDDFRKNYRRVAGSEAELHGGRDPLTSGNLEDLL